MDLFRTPLDLSELADRAGVSIRTVRYYIQQGLLAAPEARGPGAHYREEHLERLLLIKRLQREHLPLAEIRRVLESSEASAREGGEQPAVLTARDYIRDVLKRPARTMSEGSPNVILEQNVAYGSTEPGSAESPPGPKGKSPDRHTRSQWERITLARDIELHVRRPLSRVENKQVERLIDAARDIFLEDR